MGLISDRFDSIADATTEQEYNDRVQELFACNEWISDIAVQTWFSQKWLPQCKVFMFTFHCLMLLHIVQNLQTETGRYLVKYMLLFLKSTFNVLLYKSFIVWS